jgi:hypothetical protein
LSNGGAPRRAEFTGDAEWPKDGLDEGASHLVLRFAGDAERQMDTGARVR